MLIHERSTLALIFSLTGSVVPAIYDKVIFAAVMGCAACIADRYSLRPIVLAYTPLGVFGIALSIFLGFRNTSAYARWWEARQQWGTQIIAVRNMGKVLRSVLKPDHPEAINIMRYCSAHSHAMRMQYTQSVPAEKDYKSFLSEEELAFVSVYPNVADTILYLASDAVRRLYTAQEIDSFCLVAIQEQISCLGAVQGACDRLAGTPIPFTYSMLIYRTTFLFILIAPFSMVSDSGWWTPAIMAVVAYVFFGLEELAYRLEHPFGHFPSSMPLECLCRVIDNSSAIVRGVESLPPVSPVNLTLN